MAETWGNEWTMLMHERVSAQISKNNNNNDEECVLCITT